MPNSEIACLASKKMKFQVVFSCLVVLVALLATWLILGENSPFNDYFTRHDDVQDAWQITTVMPFLFSAVISKNPHSPPTLIFILAFIIQWSVVGYLLAIPMAKLWLRLQKK